MFSILQLDSLKLQVNLLFPEITAMNFFPVGMQLIPTVRNSYFYKSIFYQPLVTFFLFIAVGRKYIDLFDHSLSVSIFRKETLTLNSY